MKKVIYLCTLFLFLTTSLFSQEINQPNNGLTVRKGKITLKDGTARKFRNLKMSNETITFNDASGNFVEQKSAEVFKITKTGNYALYGCLSGGLGALAGSLSYPEPTFMLLCTAGGAAFGALIGLMWEQESTVYKNNAALSFFPTFNSTLEGNICPMLTLKINLN